MFTFLDSYAQRIKHNSMYTVKLNLYQRNTLKEDKCSYKGQAHFKRTTSLLRMEWVGPKNVLYSYLGSIVLTPITGITVEPPKVDTPRRGQCIKYLSIKDTAFVPKFTSLYKLYIEKPRTTSLQGTKPAEFIFVPKCPLFGGSTVVRHHHPYIHTTLNQSKVHVQRQTKDTHLSPLSIGSSNDDSLLFVNFVVLLLNVSCDLVYRLTDIHVQHKNH